MTVPHVSSRFTLKLRAISGQTDIATIKHGLLAMGYDIHYFAAEHTHSFYINGCSTRLLQATIHEKGIDLNLPGFSSVDDWELLRDWVLVFLTFHTAILIAENDLVEDIELFLSEEKIKSFQHEFESILNQSMRSDEAIHFYSIHRDFYAGTKIFERIREQAEQDQLSFFYELIRKSQYTTLNAINSGLVKMNENLSTSYTTIDNSHNIVLQPADMIKVQRNENDYFFISYSSIDKLIRHGWHYLDEKQIYIPKMNDNDWANFCDIAAEMSINTTLFAKYIEGEDEEGEE